MITLIHKQIIAMAGYYACCAFISLNFPFYDDLLYISAKKAKGYWLDTIQISYDVLQQPLFVKKCLCDIYQL